MGLLRKLIRKSVYTPEVKGKIGETKISYDLASLNLFGKSGLFFRNLYVPMRNGKTTEIDLVYITPKGLFVIESKNYSGYIFGNENQKYWTSTLYGGRVLFLERLSEDLTSEISFMDVVIIQGVNIFRTLGGVIYVLPILC
ncbi:MAG: NERD domain-containing protein [Lachnospiraceae bacterium]|nr:NERD domain-containing protein [Lachnospiraceae bacterium]